MLIDGEPLTLVGWCFTRILQQEVKREQNYSAIARRRIPSFISCSGLSSLECLVIIITFRVGVTVGAIKTSARSANQL